MSPAIHDVNSAVRPVLAEAPTAGMSDGFEPWRSIARAQTMSGFILRWHAPLHPLQTLACLTGPCLSPLTPRRVRHGNFLARTAHRAHAPRRLCPAGNRRESVSSGSLKCAAQANGHAPVKTLTPDTGRRPGRSQTRPLVAAWPRMPRTGTGPTRPRMGRDGADCNGMGIMYANNKRLTWRSARGEYGSQCAGEALQEGDHAT